ncbi:helix-turn-helix domain-containing protein [Labilibaculum sp.]|uniref:helix-turn-helix domain-containing protein n=1 Tax=Labilibaculum sp. TaxID=2060723 RepID=UPI002AA89CFC|nr:helix-turn-helix domain-containing protein [Labilibaculum sp.]
MAGKPKPMSQIKQLLRLHQQGSPKKTIARDLGVSKNTVKAYLDKLSRLKTDVDSLLLLDDPVLEARFHPGNPAYKDERFEHFKGKLDMLHLLVQWLRPKFLYLNYGETL